MHGKESQLVGWRVTRCTIRAAVPFARLRDGTINTDDDIAQWEPLASNDRGGSFMCGPSRGAGSRGVRGRLEEWEAQHIGCTALLHV
jgi:hypothetical protein